MTFQEALLEVARLCPDSDIVFRVPAHSLTRKERVGGYILEGEWVASVEWCVAVPDHAAHGATGEGALMALKDHLAVQLRGR